MSCCASAEEGEEGQYDTRDEASVKGEEHWALPPGRSAAVEQPHPFCRGRSSPVLPCYHQQTPRFRPPLRLPRGRRIDGDGELVGVTLGFADA